MATENKLDLDGAVFFASKDCTSRQDHSQLLKAGASTARSSGIKVALTLVLENIEKMKMTRFITTTP